MLEFGKKTSNHDYYIRMGRITTASISTEVNKNFEECVIGYLATVCQLLKLETTGHILLRHRVTIEGVLTALLQAHDYMYHWHP
jgi:hypothetical protein